jgi:asparagine synthase (glutamine-hydrolysing)
MFFSAYLGSPAQEQRWREVLERHADWLGPSAHAFSRLVADGRTFAFGWVSLRPPDTDALVREDGDNLTIIPLDTPTRAEALSQDSPRGFTTNAVRMDVSLLSGEVRVVVPLLTVEQFYHAEDGGNWVFGNDLRLMLRWAGVDVDDWAVYSFFQYDFIPPPLTVSKAVRRVPGGSAFTLPPGGGPSLKRLFDARQIAEPQPEPAIPLERIRAAVDGVLARVPPSPVVHFSGGVDSGLVAARLSALGHKDARLQNYTYGLDDPFRELAPQMAAHLGLEFEQVAWQTSEVPAILEDMAKEYSFPVSDSAMIPTMMLARAMDQWDSRPSMLLTGTVAGNAFEVGTRYAPWRRVFMIPKPLRWLAGQAYPLGLWRSESAAARAAAAMRRSTQLSLLQAACSPHGNLLGLAYDIPRGTHADMRQILLEGYEAVTEGATPGDRMILMGMIRHGATRCGARPFDAMRRRGVHTLHPFLEPDVLRAMFSLSWEERSEGEVTKALLKRLLVESVPREWVYRARAGLPLPFSDVFTNPAVQALLGDLVLSPRNPLMDLCRRRSVEQVFRRAEERESLNVGARRFVWMFTFLSLWLSQLDS